MLANGAGILGTLVEITSGILGQLHQICGAADWPSDATVTHRWPKHEGPDQTGYE